MIQFQQTTVVQKNNKKLGKDSIDPKVIDEQMILDAIKQWNIEYGILVPESQILANLKELSLSFRNIWKIQNLQGFETLVKLQLDNNIIEKIENIDHLVNLKWLDLSFNCITVIEGLDKLTQLEDLTLFDNKIEKIEGLDNCVNLNVLSIGNNKIKSYEQIISYFGCSNRSNQIIRFKKLEVLNVAGNPFTFDKESDYKIHIICNMPNLKYLDYTFIDKSDREKFEKEEKFRSTDAMKQDEYYERLKEIEYKEKQKNDQEKEKKEARMDLLDNLPNDLINNEDLDKVKLIKKAQIEEEIGKFKDKVKDVVESVQNTVKQQNIEKNKDLKKFEEAQRKREIESEKETIEIIKEFERKKKHQLRDYEKLKQEQEKGQLEDVDKKKQVEIMENLTGAIEKLKSQLMDVEIQLVEELESHYVDFERTINEFINKKIEPVIDAGQHEIENAITEFHKKLSEIVKQEQDKYQPQQDIAEDMPDEDAERINLLENKDGLNTMVGQINDNLQEKASNKCHNEVQGQINKDVTNYFLEKKEHLYERNRKNINQIHALIQKYNKDIADKFRSNDSDSEGK